MSDHPKPSERARELVRGAYDVHVHVAPDVVERITDDLSLAPRFAEAGLGGFVLKSHYFPTAERAAMVRRAVPGVGVVGAITLNGSVGGMNPLAVELAARAGARFVWLPTVDSANQRACTASAPRAPARRCGRGSRRSSGPRAWRPTRWTSSTPPAGSPSPPGRCSG